VSSEATSTVVLEMYPAPGAVVSLGDTVRLTVPGASPSSTVLLPFDLDGLVVASTRHRSPTRKLPTLRWTSRAGCAPFSRPPARGSSSRAPPRTRADASAATCESARIWGNGPGRRRHRHGGSPGLTALHLGDQQDDPAAVRLRFFWPTQSRALRESPASWSTNRRRALTPYSSASPVWVSG